MGHKFVFQVAVLPDGSAIEIQTGTAKASNETTIALQEVTQEQVPAIDIVRVRYPRVYSFLMHKLRAAGLDTLEPTLADVAALDLSSGTPTLGNLADFRPDTRHASSRTPAKEQDPTSRKGTLKRQRSAEDLGEPPKRARQRSN